MLLLEGKWAGILTAHADSSERAIWILKREVSGSADIGRNDGRGPCEKVNQDYVYASDTPVGIFRICTLWQMEWEVIKQETWHLPMRCRPLWSYQPERGDQTGADPSEGDPLRQLPVI
mgnify:CR=1 FL=1